MKWMTKERNEKRLHSKEFLEQRRAELEAEEREEYRKLCGYLRDKGEIE